MYPTPRDPNPTAESNRRHRGRFRSRENRGAARGGRGEYVRLPFLRERLDGVQEGRAFKSHFVRGSLGRGQTPETAELHFDLHRQP